MRNIFAVVPGIKPSLLNSIAGAVTALEKPVIGTRVPAPANLASLSYSPSAVNREARKIRLTLVIHLETSVSSPSIRKVFVKTCPREQMKPPTQKAPAQSRISLLSGDSFFTR